MDPLALIGVAAGVVSALGAPIAYAQLRDARKAREPAAAAANMSQALPEYAIFAPAARVRGYSYRFIDRKPEIRTLKAAIKSDRPVVSIEGISGVGKTALAAILCKRFSRTYMQQWVFCAEKRGVLSIRSLAKGLAYQASFTTASGLRAALAARLDDNAIVDGVIDLLAAERILLVLDDYHSVSDRGIRLLVERLVQSDIRSRIILTGQRHAHELRNVLRASWIELRGLPLAETAEFLRNHEINVPESVLKTIWQNTDEGNPEMLEKFAGQAVNKNPEVLALELPAYGNDLASYVAKIYRDLSARQQEIARIIAFIYEPAKMDLIRTVAAPRKIDTSLTALQERFLVRQTDAGYEMHGSLREYINSIITKDEEAQFSARITEFYQTRARQVFLGGVGGDEPSYGTLYLESFPDYFSDTARHMTFIDDLIDRLADLGFAIGRDDEILVLGSGDGTHDPGFGRHGLRITNVDIQSEIVELGRQKAADLPAHIDYVIADITKPLPDSIRAHSMAAVFNIGSSFGYEDADDENAAVFRQAAKALADGAPFVFEYVNGPHWEDKRIQRQIDITSLPNGSTRTEYSIKNPAAQVSLTSICLSRADGTTGWFRHFMHYYHLDDILAMMASAGMEAIAIYGAKGGRVTGEPFDEGLSEAMVIIAIRSASPGTQSEGGAVR
jgi:SAM-dependent methyltransferase